MSIHRINGYSFYWICINILSGEVRIGSQHYNKITLTERFIDIMVFYSRYYSIRRVDMKLSLYAYILIIRK